MKMHQTNESTIVTAGMIAKILALAEILQGKGPSGKHPDMDEAFQLLINLKTELCKLEQWRLPS